MHISRRSLLLSSAITGVAAAATACTSGNSNSESYPSKPVTILVPYGPGGGTDTIARTLGPLLEQELGQKMLIVNRPGGSGAVALKEIKAATTDGYKLIMGAAAPVIAAPRFNDVGYEASDLIAISRAVASPDCLIVTDASPYQTGEEFFKAVNDGSKVTVGVAGATGMQAIIINMINANLGSDIAPVPFDSAADAIAAVRSGDVDSAMGTTLDVGPTVTSGAAKVVAATDPAKIPGTLATNIPSLAEFGAEIPADSNWYGLMGPKGLPQKIVTTLESAMKKAMDDTDVQNKLEGIGALPGYLNAEEFNKSINEQWNAYKSIEVKPAS